MFNSFYKLILISAINLIVAAPINAKVVEQNKLDFPILPEELIKGDIHYYFKVLRPRELGRRQPELFELDSLSLGSEQNVKLVLTKSVVIINKPVGFFDDKQLVEEKYVAYISKDQRVKKTGPDTYKVIVPGEDGFQYKMQSYFDADDVSTLPNSKVIRAVTAAKKLDVISQSASTIMFTEKTNFTDYSEGAVAVSSFIPMKENKTLVITYNLYAVKDKFVNEEKLEKNFIAEIEALKKLQESFQ